MGLSGQQRKQLQSALIDAFPTTAFLEQMLAFGLEKNLRVIAGEGSLQEIVFRLIQAADAQGWVEDLIRAARKENPGNQLLKATDETLLSNPETETPFNISQKQSNQGRIQSSARTIDYKYDVFISHASEDKDDFVRFLAKKLRDKNYRVWYDEFSLSIGDSLRRSIDYGLAKTRYGIVVISPDFLRKEWPQRELDGLMAREIDGTKVILPIWHNVEHSYVLRYAPTLADRLAVNTSQGMDRVVNEIIRVLEPQSPDTNAPNAPSVDLNVDCTQLRDFLDARNWKDADYETYLVMLKVVGRKDGDWIREEELLNFPRPHLHTIDSLWVKYSNKHFGFSIQKKIYLEVGGIPDGKYDDEAWHKLGDRVGWRRRKGWRMNKEWLSYSGSEVTFDTSAPGGHLPWKVARNSGGFWSLLSHPDLQIEHEL